MKSTEMLKEIKTLLGIEVKLAQMKLDNGTVLEAEAFEAGNEVFIVTEEDKVALPVGDYELEDGQILVIQEEGIIAEIKSAEEAPAEEPAEEAEMEYVSKEEFAAAIEEIKMMIKEMMSSEDLSEEVKEEVKEELSADVPAEALADAPDEVPTEVIEAVKEDLSAPAAPALKHNPEANSQKAELFKYSNKRNLSTKDRVLEKIFNL
jgi:hypothetical protein